MTPIGFSGQTSEVFNSQQPNMSNQEVLYRIKALEDKCLSLFERTFLQQKQIKYLQKRLSVSEGSLKNQFVKSSNSAFSVSTQSVSSSKNCSLSLPMINLNSLETNENSNSDREQSPIVVRPVPLRIQASPYSVVSPASNFFNSTPLESSTMDESQNKRSAFTPSILSSPSQASLSSRRSTESLSLQASNKIDDDNESNHFQFSTEESSSELLDSSDASAFLSFVKSLSQDTDSSEDSFPKASSHSSSLSDSPKKSAKDAPLTNTKKKRKKVKAKKSAEKTQPLKKAKTFHASTEKLLNKINTLFEKGELLEAEAMTREKLESTELTEKEKSCLQYQLVLILNNYKTPEKYKEALGVIKEVLGFLRGKTGKLNNESQLLGDMYYHKSYAYSELNEHKKANKAAKKGISKLPEKCYHLYACLFNQEARSAIALGNFEEAVSTSEKGISHNKLVDFSPFYGWLHFNHTQALIELERYDTAIQFARAYMFSIDTKLSYASNPRKKTIAGPRDFFKEKMSELITDAQKKKAEKQSRLKKA